MTALLAPQACCVKLAVKRLYHVQSGERDARTRRVARAADISQTVTPITLRGSL